jgi:hypothetical protein
MHKLERVLLLFVDVASSPFVHRENFRTGGDVTDLKDASRDQQQAKQSEPLPAAEMSPPRLWSLRLPLASGSAPLRWAFR